jgi:aminoglycoside phosphotransferase (APT) family kinase protein
MIDYAPPPTPDQLEVLGGELGIALTHDHRIHGGLGGTIDVLRHENGDLVVLKRFWLPQDDDPSPAESEFRALALAAEHGIPCPAPIWIDRIGLFPERAVVIEYIDGSVLLEPSDPLDWASQLASALVRIHQIEPSRDDRRIFPRLAPGQGPHEDEEQDPAGWQHPLTEQLRAARREALSSLQPETPVYTHHDYWPGNTLWSGDQLVAVVDWEGAVIGDPAIAVATCSFDVALLGLDDAAAHFVDVYRELSGRPLPNLAYWDLFAAGRPLPDIAIWVPGLEAMGVNISVAEARSRHTSLIETALRPWCSIRI